MQRIIEGGWMPLLRVVEVKPAARLGHALILVAVVGFFAIGLYLNPNPQGYGTHQQLGLPPCTIHFLTGRPCPSCGLTTSVSACLHGDFALAWRAHPLGFIVVILAFGFGLNSLLALLAGRSLWLNPKLSTAGLLVLLSLWLVHGILRFLLA